MDPKDYTRNQCVLVIRVDGEEIECPINFGLTADEIRELYPFLLQFASSKLRNPAVDFIKDSKDGKYTEFSDEAYTAMTERIQKQSQAWYGKHEDSLLNLAIRFAIDMKLRGYGYLYDLYLGADKPVLKNNAVPDASVDEDIDLEDEDIDVDLEPTIAAGSGGNVNFSLYGHNDESADFLSDELDKMESKLEVRDHFRDVIERDVQGVTDSDPDRYDTEYKAGQFKENQMQDGLINMYDEDKPSVFDGDSDEPDYDESSNSEGSAADELPEDYEDDDEEGLEYISGDVNLDDIPDEDIDVDDAPDAESLLDGDDYDYDEDAFDGETDDDDSSDE